VQVKQPPLLITEPGRGYRFQIAPDR
jgi:hypothetical protein